MVIFLLALPFLDQKRSMATTIFMPPFTFPKTTCLPSNHSVLAVQVKSWKPLCCVQHLPWTRCQNPYCSGWNCHHQISFHSWTCLPFRYGLWSHHLSTYITEYFCENRNLYNQILSFQCSDQESFLLSLELCKQLEGDVAQGFAVDEDVEEHSGVDHSVCRRLQGGGICKSWFIFLLSCFLVIESGAFKMYSGHKSLSKYMIHKYFLPICNILLILPFRI